jgi:transposase
MALGNRSRSAQDGLFVNYDELPKSPGHVFYQRLNKLLATIDFDSWIEQRCREYYAENGRPSIPPGVYFRMIMIGYFEGLGAQRAIAWRCKDSLSLREFLGVPLTEDTPEHSSMTRVRDRLPEEVHYEFFGKIIKLAHEHDLLNGKKVGVDATTLEANAAMKSIVRRDTGEDWEAYIAGLMREAGELEPEQTPTREELKKFDKARKNKKVSNDEWVSKTDPQSRITKMKDGTTHLAYKAEHVVDLDTEIIVAAEIYDGHLGDTSTIEDSLVVADHYVQQATDDEVEIEDVVADSGYHSNEMVATLTQRGNYRTYIVEKNPTQKREWQDKPPEQEAAFRANRRRIKGAHGKALQRQRSEKVERTFAHVCETGGARRTWLCGKEKVQKRYLLAALTHNLSVIMRKLFGYGTARSLQGAGDDCTALICFTQTLWLAICDLVRLEKPRAEMFWEKSSRAVAPIKITPRRIHRLAAAKMLAFSTGC